MAEITAAQVKSLRDKTGISMGDCKKALVEAGGDETQALEILKKKYADQMEKRSHKAAANGRIGGYADGKAAALVELRCETDFVANNEAFVKAANAIAQLCATSGVTDIDQLLTTAGADGRTGKDIIADAYGTLKENINLARAECIDNGVACYVHHNGLVGAALSADATGDQTAKQVCMHIAAQPILAGLNREHVEDSEIADARERMQQTAVGKPPEIAEKIVNGKMNKWYAERVLLEQPFAMDDSKTVQQVAEEAGINITGYLKLTVGAG